MAIPKDRNQGIIKNSPQAFPGSGSVFTPTLGGATLAGPLAATVTPPPGQGFVSVSPAVQPDMARGANVVFSAGWDGGDVTIIGTDVEGKETQQVYPALPSSTIEGVRAFQNITEIRYPGAGTAGTFDVEANQRFGFGGGSDISIATLSIITALTGGTTRLFTGAGPYNIFENGAGNSMLIDVAAAPGADYVINYF